MRGFGPRDLVCISAAGVVALATVAAAQHDPVPHGGTFDAPRGEFVVPGGGIIDSGNRANAIGRSSVVFSTIVQNDNALWMRLHFSEVRLGPGSTIRMTSLLDGEVQELDRGGLAMWSDTSAFFNGDSVLLELIAAPGTQGNRVVVPQVMVELADAGQPIGTCGICGGDSRVPSNEDWAGRLAPNGCTASIFNTQSCVVSAGHCMGGNNAVHFRVPNSTPGCNTQNPGIADQFPITGTLSQDGGVGADWAVMTLGTNNLGQTAYERYGVLRPIATSPAPNGAAVSVWGYGQSQTCTLTYTQQVSHGTINSVLSTHYRALIDITFGNSGSALIRNDQIIGVVTHCSTCGTGNIMTRIDLPAFAAAIASLCPNAPVNDTCAGAITVGNGSTAFTNAGASTTGPNEPGLCNFDGNTNIQADVWFTYTATCTGDVTFSLCDGQQPPKGGECFGFCGSQAPSGCWCDEKCAGFSDCCAGVCDDCPTLSHCGGECSGFCGGQAPSGCWCDEKCAGFSDCCEGVCDDCPDLSHCAGECAGFCGGQAPSGCWCDEKCAGFSDCCEGVCGDCPDLSHCLGGGGMSLAGFDTKMAIYNFCPTGSGQAIACNKDSCGLLSSITLHAAVGQSFRIRIGGHNSATGEGILTIDCDPDPPTCPSDFNDDKVIDVSDLLQLLGAWGACPGCQEDLNGDNSVDVSDLLQLLGEWGPC